MSSSASQSNTNQTYTFKGKIFHTKNFTKQCVNDVALKSVADAFKEFWLNGYHPDFGKHAAFARPEELLNLHVRHSHVDAQDYTPEDSFVDVKGKKSVWDKWKNIYSSSFTCQHVPTSNSFLVYAVNNRRDAFVMAFIYSDAHSETETAEMKEFFTSVSYEVYQKSQTYPMSLDEDLFSEKWKI